MLDTIGGVAVGRPLLLPAQRAELLLLLKAEGGASFNAAAANRSLKEPAALQHRCCCPVVLPRSVTHVCSCPALYGIAAH